jgi:DNA polymerase I-like protein with 3'-5' exonuclease and polymerase domains
MQQVFFVTNELSYKGIILDSELELTGIEKLDEVLYRCSNERIPCTLDIETNASLDPYRGKIVLVQLKPHGQDTYVLVDLNTVDKDLVANVFKKYPNVTYFGTYLTFEYKWFSKQLGVKLEHLVDIMLIEQLLYNNSKVSFRPEFFTLKSMAMRRLKVEMDKTEQTQFSDVGLHTASQLQYAIDDVKYVEHIYQKQLPDIKRFRQENIVWLENNALKAYGDMELTGLPLDQSMWLKLYEANVVKRDQALEKLNEYFKRKLEAHPELTKWIENDEVTINWMSTKQVIELFGIVEPSIPINEFYDVKKNELRNSVSSAHLTQFSGNSELIPLLLTYRELCKACNTYGVDFLKYVHPVTQRIHCTFNQLRAKTGRVSSSKPNQQNIPSDAEYRNCFRAKEGWKIISVDYSQAEQRIAADKSGDRHMLQGFANGEDPYCTAATLMFNTTVTKEIRKDLRKIAKAIVLGYNFGIGAANLAKQVGCTTNEAQEYLTKFRKAMPQLVAYLKHRNEFAKLNRCTFTDDKFNRLCWLSPNEEVSNGELGKIGRNGQNHSCQGSNANLTKLATVKVREFLLEFNAQFEQPEAYLINQIHDELLLEVKDEHVTHIAEKTRSLMIEAGKDICDKVVMDASYVIGQHWIKD